MKTKYNISKIIFFILLILLSAGVFLVDYFVASDNFNIILPYLLIIYASVWYLGGRTGLFFTLVSAFLWLFSRTRSFTIIEFPVLLDFTIKILFIFIQYIIILRMKKAYQEVKNLSRIDELTGLNNRRGFYDLVNFELLRMSREKETVSMIFLDIDDFKLENDLKGHKEGDLILKTLGKIILSTIRKTDISARIGGDEFCIFVYKTSKDTILSFVKRITTRFEQECRKFSWHISLSIGILTTKKQCKTNDLIHATDLLMYKAKKNGKNRIEYGTL